MKQIILLALAAAAASAQAASPYISKVFEYSPAPGQFVNLLPEYSAGDTAADMADKAGECLVGDRNPGAISLGAFGGYVVFGFDHTIVNVPGEYDLRILGNAVISDRDSNGGSCEPGIVYVMRDENGNSLPDDTWYELAGAEYNAETTRHNFTVTYTRPAAGHAPTPSADSKHITDTTYIPWTASDGTTGYIEKNDYHDQSYWPEWLAAESLSFTGERLGDNLYDLNGDGSYWVLLQKGYGYVDNYPNYTDPGLKIDWAVDAQGQPVTLPGIDFVKVVSAMHQKCGNLGETSTEVCGGEDLHPDAAAVNAVDAPGALRISLRDGKVFSFNPGPDVTASLISLSGVTLATVAVPSGQWQLVLDGVPSGLYLLAAPGHPAVKVML